MQFFCSPNILDLTKVLSLSSFYFSASLVHWLNFSLCLVVAEPGRSVMSARFRLPAGRSYNVRATELERDRQHTQVVCNVLLLDNTVQAFKVNVSNLASEMDKKDVLLFQIFTPSRLQQLALLHCPL